MSTELAYRRLTVTSHGGILLPGASHNTNANGHILSVNHDIHICPIEHHGVNIVIATGFAKANGINLTRVTDRCTCGAIVGNNTTKDIKTDGEK